MGTPAILGCILGLAAAIAACVFFAGKKKDGHLSPFLQKLHDLCNFKYLFIESILKFLYIFATCAIIITGVITFFVGLYNFCDFLFHGYHIYFRYLITLLLPGLLMVVIGPFVIRIIFELTMMAVLLVKNVIEINNKLKGDGGDAFGKAPDLSDIRGKNGNNSGCAAEDTQTREE